MQAGQGGGFGEPDFFERGFPLRALEQRLFRAEVAVGEVPPAACQAEDRFGPELRRREVHEHERTARREQSVQRPQRGADIGHGVKDVGADDEIERFRLESLIDPRFLEIEDLVFHVRERRELLRRRRKEAGRDVGERVVVLAALEQRQQLGGEPRGAGADFQDAQGAAFGQRARGLLHGGGNAGHPMAGEETVSVEVLEHLGAGSAEEDLHGIFFAGQDGAEFGARRGAQQSFGQMPRVRLDERAEPRSRRRRLGRECGRRQIAVSLGLEQPAPAEPRHQAVEDRAHRRGDAERIRAEDSRGAGAHFLKPVRQLRRRQIFLGRHHGLQAALAAQAEHALERVFRRAAQAVQRCGARREAHR